MTTTQQPEAIKIADEFKLCAEYDSLPSMHDIAKAESIIRRLHARNAWLEAELIKESFRTASESNRADQMSKQHDTQAALNRDARAALSGLQKRKDDWKWRALEAESQLEAIGAGGVESLRKKEST